MGHVKSVWEIQNMKSQGTENHSQAAQDPPFPKLLCFHKNILTV